MFSAEANQLDPHFEACFAQVREHHFSRNPKYWPAFAEPGFRKVLDYRLRQVHPDLRIAMYPEGDKLHRQMKLDQKVPRRASTPDGAIDPLLAFAASLSKDWENPSSVENVITMAADPAIYGSMVGVLANPNLVYREYSAMADELERNVVRQIASLVGYNPECATGLFTQGGTFCNLYGYLFGIRKSLPQAREFGMGSANDYRIINSQGGHYSNITNLSLLGVDIRKKTIRIKLNEHNDMDLDDLELQLRSCFSLNLTVPTIMLTMGTTDTFGVDRVKPVCDLRDRLCEQFDVNVKPHIHVDSAIGWSLLFFLEYDFDANPLKINAATIEGLKRNVERFRELRYADSFTVDFQKWGYVPYTSSLVMVKNRDDLRALESDPENFLYFERDIQGQTHLQSTIECSRGASGLFGAYAALKYLGIEGYQTVLAHCLQNANYFRQRLSERGNASIMVPGNQGPSVGFRIYNPEWVKDAEAEFMAEARTHSDEASRERLERNSLWHRNIFLGRGKIGLYTNWVGFIAHTEYDEKRRFLRIPGEKAVFMNPATTREQIDLFVNHLC